VDTLDVGRLNLQTNIEIMHTRAELKVVLNSLKKNMFETYNARLRAKPRNMFNIKLSRIDVFKRGRNS
jgi:hypothetical protein